MFAFKRLMVVLSLAAACGSCGPARGKPVGGAAATPRAAAYEDFDVPAAIPAERRRAWEARLYALPAEAPKRLSLRDRLAESVAESFAAVPEDKPARRLDLFKEGLSLNAPADFLGGDVARALAPAAQWIVERYGRRGDEVVVLAGLRYLALVEPKDPRHRERFLELAEWSEGVRATMGDPLETEASVADLYLRTARLVADPEITERAAAHLVAWNAAYVARLESGAQALWGVSPLALQEAEKIPVYLAYVFYIGGDVTRAAPWIAKLQASFRSLSAFEELMDSIAAGRDLGAMYYALGQLFGSFDEETGAYIVGDPLAGLRACLDARRLGEPSPELPMCVGNFFELLERPEAAVPYYVEAARVAPVERVYLVVTARVANALGRVHALDRIEEAEQVVAMADGLVASVLALEEIQDTDLLIVTSELLGLAGDVEYADGRIDAAIAHLTQAGEVWPENVGAAFRLAEIREARGDADAALAALDALVARARKAGGVAAEYWPGRAFELRGRILLARGDAAAAKGSFEAALAAWKKADLPLDYAAEVALRRGVALDYLGDQAGSLSWIRKAIDIDPEDRGTYGTALAFAFERRRVDAAAELFQIAFNQDRIGAMWKIYFALWVEGLAGLQGRSIELARNYLEHADGEGWQDDLARYWSGRIDAAELGRRAVGKGQRVEADYYAALKLLGEGRRAQAAPLLEKVVASDLMGFFEYAMARGLLAEGGSGS